MSHGPQKEQDAKALVEGVMAGKDVPAIRSREASGVQYTTLAWGILALCLTGI